MLVEHAVIAGVPARAGRVLVQLTANSTPESRRHRRVDQTTGMVGHTTDP